MNRHQKGSALVLVMIVVLVLMMGALAAVKSTETTALMSGNSAFREATKQAADVGVTAGFAFIKNLSAVDTAVANVYFPLRQAEDTYGMPVVDWTKIASTMSQNYTVQYVTERLCSGGLPVADVVNQCVTDSAPAAGSKKLGSASYEALATIVYRVTVRTTGPKNAESYTQALISK
jgi:Tfp pilus assembly protein PilX